MDRSFIIPIAVAAGVHSMLFISGTPTPSNRPSSERLPQANFEEVQLPPLDPEELLTEEPVTKQSEQPPPPGQPDVPSPQVDPRQFVQVISPSDMLPRPPSPHADTISRTWRDDVDAAQRGNRSLLLTRDMLDNEPSARFQPAPTYPRDLKSLGEDGTATVAFSVDVNGNVFNASIVRTSHSSFGEQALRAVRQWRFDPGIKDGKRVAFRMVQTFTFTLAN